MIGLLTAALLLLFEAVLQNVACLRLAPIYLASLLIERHEAASLLSYCTTAAGMQGIDVTFHLSTHTSVTLSSRLVNHDGTM
jgi:hypothetical protein